MAKSLHGGGVDFPIRASSDQLQGDLAKAEGMVKQSAQRMRATANTSIAGSADLGPAVASSQFESNVTARMARMQESSARRQQSNMELTAARNRLGIMLPSERMQMGRFLESEAKERQRAAIEAEQQRRQAAANAAVGLSGSRYGPSMEDIESAGRSESRAGSKMAIAAAQSARMASLASGARLGLGIAGGAIAAGMFFDGGYLAQQRAFRDAGERFSFQDRNRFNDSTIRASASASAMSENPWNRLLSVVPRFADELERAAHSAAQVAEAHRTAIVMFQNATARSAAVSGRPMEAFRIGQSQELADARANFDRARRAAIDLQASGPTFAERLGLVPDNSASRQGAANRAAKEASKAHDALEEAQKKEAARQGAMTNAERFGLGEGVRAERFRGAGVLADLRGAGLQSWAANRAAEKIAMDQSFRERLAAATGDEFKTDKINDQWKQAKANFAMESRLQMRDYSLGSSGRAVSSAEGFNFGRLNRERYWAEQMNPGAMVDSAMKELTDALNANTQALQSGDFSD